MNEKQKKIVKKIVILIIPIIILIVSYKFFKYGYSLVDSTLINARWTNERVVAQMGIFGYLIYDIESNISSSLKTVSEQQILDAKNHIQNFQRNNSQFIKQKTKKNVLLVQMESMDGVLMNAFYNGKEILPNLNNFASESIYFPNTFDVTGTGRTSDGEFATLTSLLPIQNEVVYEKYDIGKIYSLPKILSDNGYKTISMHGYKQEFWNRVVNHKLLGYQKSYFMKDLNEDDMVGWGISDKSMVKQAVDVLEKEEEPVFLHLILLTNHHPYTYAPQSIIPYVDKIEENYINSAHYQDEAMGMLFDELQKTGLLNDTIVMIYGDHDSAITRKMYAFLGLEFDEKAFRNDKIPMMLYTGLESSIDYTYRGQTDIAPLILDNLNIEIPKTMLGNGKFYNQTGVLKQNNTIITDNNGVAEVQPAKIETSNFTKVIINKGLDILK